MTDLKGQFDEVSARYDAERRALIPCFDDFYSMAVAHLDLEAADPEILDLGAGTGLFSSFVLRRYPGARMRLVDLSEGMLSVARERFSGMENVSYRTVDLKEIVLEGRYDAVVSSLAIHHLPDPEKIALYKKVYEALKPGGLFVNAEQVLADTPYLRRMYRERWENVVESSGLGSEAIEKAYRRAELDIRTPLNVQLKWLEEIGFAETDCLYKRYDFAVIWA